MLAYKMYFRTAEQYANHHHHFVRIIQDYWYKSRSSISNEPEHQAAEDI